MPSRFGRLSLRWLLLGFAVAFLVVVGVIVGSWWYSASSGLEAELEALRAAGLPTTASEVNAFYVVPEGVSDSTEEWMAVIAGADWDQLGRRVAAIPIIGNGPTPVPVPGEPWAEFEESKALLQDYQWAVQGAHEAAAVGGRLRFPTDYSAGVQTRLPHLQNARMVARLLSLDAYVSAHAGNDAQALQDVQAIAALANAMRGEPVLIGQLVRMAIHAMACDEAIRLMPHCDWNDAQLESLQESIGAAQFGKTLLHSLRGERGLVLGEIDRVVPRPLRGPNKRETLRMFELTTAGLSGSWRDALETSEQLETRLVEHRQGTFSRLGLSPVLMLMPGIDQAIVAGAKSEARQRCAIIAIAAERFRLEQGRWPESLEEIPRELLGPEPAQNDALVDPFTGQPLRFRSLEEQLVFYSVGDDLEDDGGAVGEQDGRGVKDVGVSLKKSAQ